MICKKQKYKRKAWMKAKRKDTWSRDPGKKENEKQEVITRRKKPNCVSVLQGWNYPPPRPRGRGSKREAEEREIDERTRRGEWLADARRFLRCSRMFLANVLQVSVLREPLVSLGAIRQVVPVGARDLRGFAVGLWGGDGLLFEFIGWNLPPD